MKEIKERVTHMGHPLLDFIRNPLPAKGYALGR